MKKITFWVIENATWKFEYLSGSNMQKALITFYCKKYCNSIQANLWEKASSQRAFIIWFTSYVPN